MQLTSTLALLAATSNALALQASFPHENCGNYDYFENCREMVWVTNAAWHYNEGEHDHSWSLEDYQKCLDSALVD